MSDIDTEQQAVPAETGDIPAASPTADAPAVPEPVAETSGEDTAAEAEKEKPKGGFQRRISELTREQRRLREELARERAEREALQRGQPSEEPPQREKFATWEEYEAANVRFIARQEIRNETAALRQAEAARAQAAQMQTLHEQWESKWDAARDKYDDIDDYVEVVGEKLTPDVALAIKAADAGPELVRYLGQNPRELDRITSLPGVQAVYELARLETKLTAKPKASAAPNPPSNVRTTSAPQNALRDDIDVKAWMERRRAELKR